MRPHVKHVQRENIPFSLLVVSSCRANDIPGYASLGNEHSFVTLQDIVYKTVSAILVIIF